MKKFLFRTCEKQGRKSLLKLIKLYQINISPLSHAACRFYPTCSQYSYQAIERFGVLRGTFLATRRILRCHPFSRGGLDPLPKIS